MNVLNNEKIGRSGYCHRNALGLTKCIPVRLPINTLRLSVNEFLQNLRKTRIKNHITEKHPYVIMTGLYRKNVSFADSYIKLNPGDKTRIGDYIFFGLGEIQIYWAGI